MCSNGPLVGIVPHKSLFEMSTTLRLEVPTSSLGIGPVNLLSLSRLPNNKMTITDRIKVDLPIQGE
uniref:LRR receptor-like protein kinase n=1 Tax=Rhizophora mucronata TaxID=61149 RepID=A0A2P2J1P4_RHIMU